MMHQPERCVLCSGHVDRTLMKFNALSPPALMTARAPTRPYVKQAHRVLCRLSAFHASTPAAHSLQQHWHTRAHTYNSAAPPCDVDSAVVQPWPTLTFQHHGDTTQYHTIFHFCERWHVRGCACILCVLLHVTDCSQHSCSTAMQCAIATCALEYAHCRTPIKSLWPYARQRGSLTTQHERLNQ
jgi:hypothetical protein